jgi:hypothetical protein
MCQEDSKEDRSEQSNLKERIVFGRRQTLRRDK